MRELKIKEGFGSIMVLVPHQDDEILMAAGVLYQAVQAGLPVTVVMVTNGDCDCRDYTKGRTRLRETILGCKRLGVQEEQLVFLGYADTGMPEEDSFVAHLFGEQEPSRVYSSHCSYVTYSLEEKPEFHMEITGEHAPYTREMLKSDLKQVIERYHPRNIFTTSEFDMHGDHAGLCRFVYEVLEEMEKENADSRQVSCAGKEEPFFQAEKENADFPQVYCGLVHSCAGDDNWPIPDTETFDCPKGLEENTNYVWDQRFVLQMPDELKRSTGKDNLKYQALLAYETALEPNAYEFLMAFVKDEEIFWKVR